jgi:predicted Fe-Mo cluster-binding NifX family protein
MKVVVSSLGTTLDDPVDERFGRAVHLLICDTETLQVDARDNNANRNALQGAGLGAAEIVAGSGANTVITGHLGPKAYKALKMAGVDGFCGTGMTVREAIEAHVDGRLKKLSEDTAGRGME